MSENQSYLERIQQEAQQFNEQVNVHDLPPIFHYWAHTYLRPMVEEFGVTSPDEWFAEGLSATVPDHSRHAKFLSVGSGNCDTEIRVAALLKNRGLENFRVACLEINSTMLERGQALAEAAGLAPYMEFIEADFNTWKAGSTYNAVMANQSLHHVVDLEHLLDQIRSCLAPSGALVISDIIGRNGHMRWDEALERVHEFWLQMPKSYRYNRVLQRQEDIYENWDCSKVGFEGIRAQDILPLLIENFHFSKFIAFGNVIDPFVDRGFGHNFNPDGEWDKLFIDRIHAADEQGFVSGELKPTHLMAVVNVEPQQKCQSSRGLEPQWCVRVP